MEEEERSQSNNSMPVYSARLARESMGGGSGRGETVQIVVFFSQRRLYAISSPSLRRLYAVSTPSLLHCRSTRQKSAGLEAIQRGREREKSKKDASRERERKREGSGKGEHRGVPLITTALPGPPDAVLGIYNIKTSRIPSRLKLKIHWSNNMTVTRKGLLKVENGNPA